MLKLQALELSKSNRGRKVVDDLNLEISQGEVVGLLGPNGAGKTTTFYILVGLARPDSGRVLLNGDDITTSPGPSGPAVESVICRKNLRFSGSLRSKRT